MQSMAISLLLSPIPFTTTGAARSRGYIPSSRLLKCVAALDFSVVPDPSDFAKAAKIRNVIPLRSCIFSDQLTPIIAYRCLVKDDDREAPSFIFESVEPGPMISTVGRYSMVGANPSIEIATRENRVSIMDREEGTLREEFVDDPMLIPRRISDGWKPQLVCDLPDAFCGGWVGYFSYDTVRYVENKKLPFFRAPKDDRNLPDMHIGLYDDVIVFDHVKKKLHVIHWVRMDRYSSTQGAYLDGIRRLRKLVAKLQTIDYQNLSGALVQLETRNFASLGLTDSNMTREEYMELVSKAKEHIVAGDVLQVVLSQRFERRTFADPFQVYRALRAVNPSRYMAYLQARRCTLVASSTQEITGELRDGLCCWDTLRAALPLGTVSGCPKVKAMELIDQLEVTRRGPYGGCYGSVSFTGELDMALSVQTIVFPTSSRMRFDRMYYENVKKRRGEWIADIQVGGSIVGDSDPDDEYWKCRSEAASMARAIDLAEQLFPGINGVLSRELEHYLSYR